MPQKRVACFCSLEYEKEVGLKGPDIVEKQIPKDIKDILVGWSKYYHRWWFLHYLLGAVGTISSITVASQPKILINIPYLFDILAWIAAICIALITFLMPSRRAKAYVAAWRLLFHATNKFKHSDNGSIDELFEALKKGEELIGSTDP